MNLSISFVNNLKRSSTPVGVDADFPAAHRRRHQRWRQLRDGEELPRHLTFFRTVFHITPQVFRATVCIQPLFSFGEPVLNGSVRQYFVLGEFLRVFNFHLPFEIQKVLLRHVRKSAVCAKITNSFLKKPSTRFFCLFLLENDMKIFEMVEPGLFRSVMLNSIQVFFSIVHIVLKRPVAVVTVVPFTHGFTFLLVQMTIRLRAERQTLTLHGTKTRYSCLVR